MKNLWMKIKTIQNGKNRKLLIAAGLVLLLLLIGGCIIAFSLNQSQTPDSEETRASSEKKTGVTESGSVDVGTTTQSFDLDISEFSGESGLNISAGMGAMGGMMGFNMESNSSTSDSSASRQLIIEEVYVEAGEEAEKGTALLKLTEDSVNSIRSLLEEDVRAAEIVYNQTLTLQKQALQEAEASLKINTLYGSYSQSEYRQTIEELQKTVETGQEELTKAEETLTEAREELTEKQTLLAEEQQVLANAVYTEEGTDKEESLYWWIIAFRTREEAESLVDTLETEIEELSEDILKYETEVKTAQTSLSLANKELETGKEQARIQLSKRSYQYENAQEIYDVAVEQSDFDTQNALRDYEKAKTKLEEFDAVIVNQVIYSEYEGLITDVLIAKGDTLTQNMDLINMYDYNAVTITLSIEESDKEAAALGSQAEVVIAAFENQIFTGVVTEIGDAEIDSNTNKTFYSVTVTVTNTDKLLYQDMTAEVTFQSNAAEEVLYAE